MKKNKISINSALNTIVFVLLFSVLIYTNYLYDSYQLTKAFLILLISSIFIGVSLFSSDIKKPGISLSIFFVYILYICIRTLLSNTPVFYYYLLAPVAAVVFIFPVYFKIDIKKLLIIINTTAFLASVYGIIQFATGIQRPYSFFGNPIFFGEYLLLSFPLLFVSSYFFKKNNLFFIINTVLALSAIFLISSRGVFISLIVSAAMLLLLLMTSKILTFSRKKHLKPTLIISAIIITLLLIIPATRSKLSYNFQRLSSLTVKNNSAVLNRILMGKTALTLFKQNPVFGSGSGSYRLNYQKIQSGYLKKIKNFNFLNSSYAHNDYLQFLSEFGIVGLLLFLSVVMSVILSFDNNNRKYSNKNYIFSAALISSVTAILIESFFNFPLFVFPAAFLFWFYLGILNSFSCENNLKPKNLISIKIIGGIVLILLIAFIIPGFNKVRSNHYLKKAIHLSNINNPDYKLLFNKALVLDDYFYTRYYFAQAEVRSMRLNSAMFHYKGALNMFPNSADMYFNIAVVNFAQKDFHTAVKNLQKSIDLYPNFANAHLILAKTYTELNMDEKAASEFTLAAHHNRNVLYKDLSKTLLLLKEVTDIR